MKPSGVRLKIAAGRPGVGLLICRLLITRLLMVGLLVVGLVGCSLAPSTPVRQDELVGKILRASGEPVEQQTLLDELAAADVVYLGEKHDNAGHHRAQLEILQGLLERGVRPAIGFEFFDSSQTGLLMQYVDGKRSAMAMRHGSKGPSAEERLRRQLGWAERPDEEWNYYFQLVELAKEHKLAVFGADLPRGSSLRLSRSGREALNGVESGLLADTGFEDEAYRELMFEKFTEAHCGWGEPALLERLYQTWVARNDRMARSITEMRKEDSERPVIMILGKGHTEHGMGVFERVAHLNPGIRQVNLGLSEIAIEAQPFEVYLRTDERFGPTHQLYWFFQRQDYDDPCKGMKLPG